MFVSLVPFILKLINECFVLNNIQVSLNLIHYILSFQTVWIIFVSEYFIESVSFVI